MQAGIHSNFDWNVQSITGLPTHNVSTLAAIRQHSSSSKLSVRTFPVRLFMLLRTELDGIPSGKASNSFSEKASYVPCVSSFPKKEVRAAVSLSRFARIVGMDIEGTGGKSDMGLSVLENLSVPVNKIKPFPSHFAVCFHV
jgi:hypothetical protein